MKTVLALLMLFTMAVASMAQIRPHNGTSIGAKLQGDGTGSAFYTLIDSRTPFGTLQLEASGLRAASAYVVAVGGMLFQAETGKDGTLRLTRRFSGSQATNIRKGSTIVIADGKGVPVLTGTFN